MSVTIREARPDDAAFLASIMLIAGRSQLNTGLWDVVFPGPDQEKLEILKKLSVTDALSFCHYSCFMIGEWDGKPAAALCGFDPKHYTNKGLIHALKEIGHDIDMMQSFFRKITPFMTCYPDTPEGMWIIECVGALPEFRNRGIVSSLLKETMQKGRGLGYETCQIAVQIGNVPARHAYIKAGFMKVDEKRDPSYVQCFGAAGLERLRIRL
jgi:ribosomal protein S18 acetylase RimI-like enzyme